MELEMLTQLEARVTVLGYLQRSGEPSPADRILTTRFGAAAVKLVDTAQFGKMVNIDGPEAVGIPLSAILEKIRSVPVEGEMLQLARELGVSFGE